MKRRTFIRNTGLLGLGLAGLRSYAWSFGSANAAPEWKYGELMEDPQGIINLPEGFTYKILSQNGDEMNDGLLVPGRHDGSASFAGKKGVVLVRNHEISPGDEDAGAFGMHYDRMSKADKMKFYDFGEPDKPCLGGTTTLVFDENSQEITYQYMSLFGTVRNCAGGKTPWNSWITCEESVLRAGGGRQKDHGFNFEVPVSESGKVAEPIPLRDMGRMNHEAVAVDPETGIVYQTEDRHDGLIYRFLPNRKGNLGLGGKLQALAVKGQPSFDTRNWDESSIKERERFNVEWIDMDDVLSPEDDLRHRGFDKGAARFARGEGAWFGEKEFYFACTNGGEKKNGQIFRYHLSPFEGTNRESESPGQIELFAEPNDSDIMKNCDNLTIAPNGDVLLVEDHPHPFIVGITQEGEYYKLGENTGYRSEMTGINFSPSGKTLFVNIQKPGLTLAIQGPFA